MRQPLVIVSGEKPTPLRHFYDTFTTLLRQKFDVKLRYCGQILIFNGFGFVNDNWSHVRTECGGNPKTLSVELTEKLHEID